MSFVLTPQRNPAAKRSKRLDDHHADFTPQGASLICCITVNDLLFKPDLTICTRMTDPTAGGGGFGWSGRKLWPAAKLIGNDIREEEATNLAANYDDVFIGDFAELEDKALKADLLLTNPPFKLAAELWEDADRLVVPGGWCCLLVRITLGDDAKVCRKIWGSQVEKSGRAGFHFVESECRYGDLRRPHTIIEFSNRFRFREGINPKTGQRYGSDSTTYRLICRQVGVDRHRMDPMRYFKLDRMDDRLFSWMIGSDGAPIRPGEEWLFNDHSAEAAVVDLARRSWLAHFAEGKR